MARAGRNRKTGLREANGRAQRKPETPWTPEIVARRSELVGKEKALDPKAGEALGVLLHRGVIDQRQYDAGIAFERFHRSWRAMAGGKHPWEMPSTGDAPFGVSVAAWQKARDKMREVKARIDALSGSRLVRATLETFVIDALLPPIIESGLRLKAKEEPCHPALRALCEGLDAIAPMFTGVARF